MLADGLGCYINCEPEVVLYPTDNCDDLAVSIKDGRPV